jgi:hypothetical protein
MPTFKRDQNGRWVDKKTGEPLNAPGKPFTPSMPMIMKPMPTYQSPIDGRPINSRQERIDDLKRNNCVEWEPSMSPTKGKFRNKRFAKKRGLTIAEEYK